MPQIDLVPSALRHFEYLSQKSCRVLGDWLALPTPMVARNIAPA
jgi:hypothetical protein